MSAIVAILEPMGRVGRATPKVKVLLFAAASRAEQARHDMQGPSTICQESVWFPQVISSKDHLHHPCAMTEMLAQLFRRPCLRT